MNKKQVKSQLQQSWSLVGKSILTKGTLVSFNKLLVQLIGKYINNLRRKRKNQVTKKLPINKSNDAKLPQSSTSFAVNTTPLSFPPKIISINNNDKQLIKEQQRDKENKLNINNLIDVVKLITNNNLALPVNNKALVPTAVPINPVLSKLISNDADLTLPVNNMARITRYNGDTLIIPEKDLLEMEKESKKAEKYREEASKAETEKETARLEAKAAKAEGEAIRIEKAAIEKQLDDKNKQILNDEIISTQKSLGYKVLKKLYTDAVRLGAVKDEKLTQSAQFINALNNNETTKLYFTQIEVPENLNKTERKQFENSVVSGFNNLLIDIKKEKQGTGLVSNGKNKLTTFDGTLSNFQIDKLMKEKKNWNGVYSVDTLPDFGTAWLGDFIVNTSPRDKPFGHWVALHVTNNTIEYYDPLGLKPSPTMYRELSRALRFEDNLSDKSITVRQFKINRMQDQNIHSNNCGWFAMKFLNDRNRGHKWIDATGFNKLGESEIEKYKNKYKFKFV